MTPANAPVAKRNAIKHLSMLGLLLYKSKQSPRVINCCSFWIDARWSRFTSSILAYCISWFSSAWWFHFYAVGASCCTTWYLAKTRPSRIGAQYFHEWNISLECNWLGFRMQSTPSIEACSLSLWEAAVHVRILPWYLESWLDLLVQYSHPEMLCCLDSIEQEREVRLEESGVLRVLCAHQPNVQGVRLVFLLWQVPCLQTRLVTASLLPAVVPNF